MAEFLVAVLTVLAVAGVELPALIRRRQVRELITFGSVWTLGALMTIAYGLGVKPPGLLSLMVAAVRSVVEAFFGPVE